MKKYPDDDYSSILPTIPVINWRYLISAKTDKNSAITRTLNKASGKTRQSKLKQAQNDLLALQKEQSPNLIGKTMELWNLLERIHQIGAGCPVKARVGQTFVYLLFTLKTGVTWCACALERVYAVIARAAILAWRTGTLVDVDFAQATWAITIFNAVVVKNYFKILANILRKHFLNCVQFVLKGELIFSPICKTQGRNQLIFSGRGKIIVTCCCSTFRRANWL